MSGIIDLSGYVLVPRKRLEELEAIEAKHKIRLFDSNSVLNVVSTMYVNLERSKFDFSDFNWPPRPPVDAPEPKETAEYTVNFYNDMGHLGYHFTPDYKGKDSLLNKVLPYSSQDMRDVYKNINGFIHTYLKLKPDRPMKRNVSVKLDGEWVTVCLDYTSIDHHIEE